MRVTRRGVNRISKRLASGERVTYFYAWKGGPRPTGQPGSAEFIASYEEAHHQKTQEPAGVLNAY